MSYKKHAELEFKAAGWTDKEGNFTDEMQKLMCRQVLELLELFFEHGHSGASIPYAINLFKKLASFEPLTPLTGEDWEWSKIGENRCQNKRCSHVFRDADGRAYDIEGKIFRDKNGSCWTNTESRVFINFPYTPKREYIDRDN
jgi:hypothetical protein